jgi:N-acetylmuramoyl-L-alanine amidase
MATNSVSGFIHRSPRKAGMTVFFTLLFLCLIQFFIFPAQAAELLKIQTNSNSETIIINAKNLKEYKVFTVPDPDRLVVDIPQVAAKNQVSLADDYDGKIIKSARFGQFDKKTSRFVFDLNTKISVVSKKAESGSLQVEISQAGSDKRSAVSKKEVSSHILTTKNLKPKAQSLKPSTANYKTLKPPSQIPTIAIDAGHGGVDSGAIGEGGTYEKDIVLQYAKVLREKLMKSGKYRVILTRDSDIFIPLRGRVAIARKAGANLFVSIHADSADDGAARGLSVYTVSETASDKEAEALAARENKSDIIGGMDLSDERPEVADILISLAQRATKNSSAFFADLLVIALDDRVHLLPNPHRFAGFAVLKAPDIPSVLVEVGFISHPKQEKELKSESYRDKVTSGIVAGIDNYFAKKNSGQVGGV